ncbi:hypothetical protein DFH09DRAFT_1323878 [Mycena vulgaris]|nr:hypothetical protein DFH09DRAFT_1323878 [Mycena vulgaris]
MRPPPPAATYHSDYALCGLYLSQSRNDPPRLLPTMLSKPSPHRRPLFHLTPPAMPRRPPRTHVPILPPAGRCTDSRSKCRRSIESCEIAAASSARRLQSLHEGRRALGLARCGVGEAWRLSSGLHSAARAGRLQTGEAARSSLKAHPVILSGNHDSGPAIQREAVSVAPAAPVLSSSCAPTPLPRCSHLHDLVPVRNVEAPITRAQSSHRVDPVRRPPRHQAHDGPSTSAGAGIRVVPRARRHCGCAAAVHACSSPKSSPPTRDARLTRQIAPSAPSAQVQADPKSASGQAQSCTPTSASGSAPSSLRRPPSPRETHHATIRASTRLGSSASRAARTRGFDSALGEKRARVRRFPGNQDM